MPELTTFAADDRSTSVGIPLTHMPQQVHVWSADDDWTGVVDRRERRKLQNRQNQRKWRERRKASARGSGSPASSSTGTGTGTSTISLAVYTASNTVQHQDNKAIDTLCDHAPPNAQEYLRAFEARLRQSYITNSPDLDHLIGLTRLNVHRAIRENIRAIGMTIEWTNCDDSLSIFNLTHPHGPSSTGPFTLNIEKIPLALRPTHIQKTTPHHPWLDFFPFPSMRDTLITASAGLLFDDDELCHDLMAFWDTRNTQATLIVWGASWEPRNWEVSEAFARKWGWLLVGCEELLVSTNVWRRRRGERAINWGRVLGSKSGGRGVWDVVVEGV
ncbi:bZIP transcription factor [Aspergillus mulundensis]|uniref:BZIP domain-containing protein n=1 Tax=Aspergillus mulundensis TaxID=1810919 RepID=A0A3D8SIE3_9EURO|nr:Uncharacterized protein DSM5745_02705 [Aspergillus mulundensis]RDW86063.1 Uncharacterized protein DSM5745_02705 [Aspergillus mulundensis]